MKRSTAGTVEGRAITALTKTFEEKRRDRYKIHDAIDATYSTFERDGKKFVQIDTYGPAERESLARPARPFSSTRPPPAALFDILREAFGFR